MAASNPFTYRNQWQDFPAVCPWSLTCIMTDNVFVRPTENCKIPRSAFFTRVRRKNTLLLSIWCIHFTLGHAPSQTGLLIANGSASTKSNPRVFLLWNNRSYWAASYHCSYLSANPVWPDFLIHHSPGTSCLAEGLMNCFLALTLISKLLHCHPEMQLQATKTVLRHSFHPACVHNASGAHSDGHETY